jgi:large subunit ribosomal protein L17
MKKNLVVNLFTNDRIKTTLERAKEIRGDVDRVVTWAKRGDVHSRRLAIAKLGDKNLVAEIFSKVEQGMFQDRPGGYSRILRLGTRRGDSATIVIMELAQEPLAKKANKDAVSAAAGKKPSARKSLTSRLRGRSKDEGETNEVTGEPEGDAEEIEEAEDAEEAAGAEAEAEVEVEAGVEVEVEVEVEDAVTVAEDAVTEVAPEAEDAVTETEAEDAATEIAPEAEAATEAETDAAAAESGATEPDAAAVEASPENTETDK